jgi:hypothetical protein
MAEPHLAAGERVPAVRPEGGRTEGISVKISKVLGSAVQEDSSLFCELVQRLIKLIKNSRKSKNSKPNFAELSVTRTITLSKWVYTFEF